MNVHVFDRAVVAVALGLGGLLSGEGAKSENKSVSVEGKVQRGHSAQEAGTQLYPDGTPITLHLVGGTTVFCKEGNPMGLLYPPPGSESPSNYASCDQVFLNDTIAALDVNGIRVPFGGDVVPYHFGRISP